jgi:hypothetical protein
MQLLNPNAILPLSMVQSPDVVAGEFRYLPWSDPTEPVAIGNDAEYYLTSVKPPRGGNATATFNVFQLNDKVGTLAAAEMNVEPGAIIGGTKKTKVISPAIPPEMQGKMTDEDVLFISRDVLVDVGDAGAIDRKLHPDLAPGARLVDQALIATPEGELALLDPYQNLDDHNRIADRYRRQTIELNVKDPSLDPGRLEQLAEAEALAEQRRGGRAGGENPTRRQPRRPRPTPAAAPGR